MNGSGSARIPPRRSENAKRRLHANPSPALRQRVADLTYVGSPKHKRNPQAFGLLQYAKHRGDATLCDEDAGFDVRHLEALPDLVRRAAEAGLLSDSQINGDPTIVWTVSDEGWIFEARITNPGNLEYHGYPVRPTESIAEKIHGRFRAWASEFGSPEDRNAAARCAQRYRFTA